MSVISTSGGDIDDEADELKEEMSTRRTRSQTRAAREGRSMSTGSFMWSSKPIGQISSISDIGDYIDSDLKQATAISRLEERWRALTSNFERVLGHLQECSKEVSFGATLVRRVIEQTVRRLEY